MVEKRKEDKKRMDVVEEMVVSKGEGKGQKNSEEDDKKKRREKPSVAVG